MFLGMDVPTIYSRHGISAEASSTATLYRFLTFLHIIEIFDTESER